MNKEDVVHIYNRILFSHEKEWNNTVYSHVGKEELKIWLKTQHSENKDHGIRSHRFMANRWGNSGNSERPSFGGLQNHCRW